MKIYVAHSTQFNFKEELYSPLKNSELNTKHELVFPHADSLEPFSSKEYLNFCDLVIAEVSFPSTGMGIELGWANAKNIKIICVYKKGVEYSKSLHTVSQDFVEYFSHEDLVNKIKRLF